MRPETANNRNNAATKPQPGFLSRLARDARGNALMITAAFFIPLAAAIGGGVDMSRAYLAKARLNQACDAAAIAARRSMSGLDITSGNATAQAEGTKFFNFNFPAGTMDSTPINPDSSGVSQGPTYSKPDDGVVRVTAATNVPTTVMKIFGYQQIPISVSCDATQNFNNIDIVLVLDVTGSMGSKLNWSDTQTKIEALQSAVMALYNELSTAQTQLTNQGLRLRYGIVPYNSMVNVGKLVYAKNHNYIVSDNWTYQSRYWGTYTTVTYTPSNTSTSSTQNVNSVTKNYCSGLQSSSSTGTQPDPVTTTTVTTSWSKSGNGSNGTCIITTTKTVTTYTANQTQTTGWTYQPVTYDVSQYVTGATAYTPTGSNGSNSGATWNGCIEERQTVSTITASSSTGVANIPSGAKDLNIDLIPTDNTSRWAPAYPNVSYRPTSDSSRNSGSKSSSYCPVEASRLAVMTQTDMQNYVNTLTAVGSTYHDIGMIWGARFISSNGIFGDDNPTIYNNEPVSKYIIFMSDGILEPDSNLYESYGIETYDQRVEGGAVGTYWGSGNGTDLEKRHSNRFLMACNAAKAMGVSVWTIAFSTTDMANLQACASNADQYALSSSSAALIAKFQEIGKNIGALRLAK